MGSPDDLTQRFNSTLLSVEGLSKAFPGVLALDGVSLEVRGGQIVAIVGHNGSGKSTLVKVLAGIYKQDAGMVMLLQQDGETASLHFIHQDLGLIPALSSVENLNLGQGRGPGALAPTRSKAERKRTRALISRYGPEFDVDAPMSKLTPAQRAVVAIARALDGWTHARNVVVLDEPTEALHKREVDVLFSVVRRVAADGAGVIFVSHRLDEVLDLADRVVVLRDGLKVADEPTADLDHSRLVALVTGAAPQQHSGRALRASTEQPVLRIAGMTGETVENFDLDLHPREIVGVAGVLGSGREEVPSLIFGATDGVADEYLLDGRPYDKRSPAESIRRGMAFAAGDRARLGAVRDLNARENITLPRLSTLRSRTGSVDLRHERAETTRLATDFGVRPANVEQKFSLFSGGNQQKIVMAKWMRNKPTVLLLEEPTQGVDIGAKASIYAAVEEASRQGAAVLVCSSDAKELLRLCHRVLVLRDGKVAAELEGGDLTEHRVVLAGYGLTETTTKAAPTTPKVSETQ